MTTLSRKMRRRLAFVNDPVVSDDGVSFNEAVWDVLQSKGRRDLAEEFADMMTALDAFLNVVHRMDMGPLDHLTCQEVEALADLAHVRRGEGPALQVILNHLGDDEEHEELSAHLNKWRGLRSLVRSQYSDDCPIITTLNELEKEEAAR